MRDIELARWAFHVALVVKNPPVNAGDRHGFDPWVRKIPWRRASQLTSVFLLGGLTCFLNEGSQKASFQ